ncbi:MAG: gliding motility-associated-like protein [Crocinitomicaceae bacterium]|jgi:gliding motility-associated-like protein
MQSIRLIISTLLVGFASLSLHAQTTEWLITAGLGGSDKGTTIKADDAGNTYITGYYNSEANFGPFYTGYSFASSKEVYVAKIDPDGNYLWVKNGINYYDDRGLGLCLDPAGNVYVTGTCWGGLDFGMLSVYNSSSWSDQIFVIKLDSDGNEIWMKNAGNDDTGSGFTINENGLPQTLYQDDHGQDLASDSQGNIYVTGFLSNVVATPGVANFDAIAVPLNPNDSVAFLAKLANDGTWQWVRTFEGIYQHRDNAVAVDNDDNIYVTGGFVETSNFEGTILNSVGGEDIYVIKYDSDGNFMQVTQAGGLLDDRGDAITFGNDNTMYIGGEFRDTCHFGPQYLNNHGSASGRDAFVARMAKDGQWLWAARAGSNKGKDRVTSICANSQGNVFVSGQYSSDAKFGSLEVNSAGDSVQAFVAGIDTCGIWQWVREGGGVGFDRAAGVDVDENCNLYFTGYFTNAMTFDGQSVAPNQGKDIFSGKISDVCFAAPCTAPPPPPPPTPEEPEIEHSDILPINVFTPNGDGVNDFLIFSTSSNMDVTIVIVNRWGEIVYESNDPLHGWDGTGPNGQLVKDGTYFYQIVKHFKLGNKEEIKGFLTILTGP